MPRQCCDAHDKNLLRVKVAERDRMREPVRECGCCRRGWQWMKVEEIKAHVAAAHGEQPLFPCPACDDAFGSYPLLFSHYVERHDLRPYAREEAMLESEKHKCSLCGKAFVTKHVRDVHVRNVHEKANETRCPACGDSFCNRQSMEMHMRRLHMGEAGRSLLCDACGKGFVNASELRKHVEHVHLKVHRQEAMCEVCGKAMSCAAALKVHMNVMHTQEKTFPCPDCKVVFHALASLTCHRRRMHPVEGERTNTCGVCGKNYHFPSELRRHVRIVHENERSFVCDVCGKAFKVSSQLVYHRRRHTGETPHECAHCGKLFHSPTSIGNHMRKVHKATYMGVKQRRKMSGMRNDF
nr:zinc finger protein 728-like [Penaeus vannamei]